MSAGGPPLYVHGGRSNEVCLAVSNVKGGISLNFNGDLTYVTMGVSQ